MMLRGVVRAVPNSPAASLPATMPMMSRGNLAAGFDDDDESLDEIAAEKPVEAPKARMKRRTTHGPSMREELANLVQEDPDAAVAVLRNWIGAGA
jgi:flagellar biosynthesis/type III secretory pathway M-ring protein FliF/YscJ